MILRQGRKISKFLFLANYVADIRIIYVSTSILPIFFHQMKSFYLSISISYVLLKCNAVKGMRCQQLFFNMLLSYFVFAFFLWKICGVISNMFIWHNFFSILYPMLFDIVVIIQFINQLRHMRTNKNCPKYGKDLEVQIDSIHIEKSKNGRARRHHKEEIRMLKEQEGQTR